MQSQPGLEESDRYFYNDTDTREVLIYANRFRESPNPTQVVRDQALSYSQQNLTLIDTGSQSVPRNSNLLGNQTLKALFREYHYARGLLVIYYLRPSGVRQKFGRRFLAAIGGWQQRLGRQGTSLLCRALIDLACYQRLAESIQPTSQQPVFSAVIVYERAPVLCVGLQG